MDRKSKILLFVVFFLFLGTVLFAYVRYIVFRDFEIFSSEELEESEVIDDQSNIQIESDETQGSQDDHIENISQ